MVFGHDGNTSECQGSQIVFFSSVVKMNTGQQEDYLEYNV